MIEGSRCKQNFVCTGQGYNIKDSLSLLSSKQLLIPGLRSIDQ